MKIKNFIGTFSSKHDSKSAKSGKNSSDKKAVINAYRDWQILVTIFFLVNITVVFLCLYFYRQISEGQIFSTSSPVAVTQQIISTKELSQTVGIFQARSVGYTQYLNGAPLVTDPSL